MQSNEERIAELTLRLAKLEKKLDRLLHRRQHRCPHGKEANRFCTYKCQCRCHRVQEAPAELAERVRADVLKADWSLSCGTVDERRLEHVTLAVAVLTTYGFSMNTKPFNALHLDEVRGLGDHDKIPRQCCYFGCLALVDSLLLTRAENYTLCWSHHAREGDKFPDGQRVSSVGFFTCAVDRDPA